MATLWVLTGHWIYLDGRKLVCLATLVATLIARLARRSRVSEWVYFFVVLGVALSVLMIQLVRVPNLKISTILLLGLLVYDVFWVSSIVVQVSVYSLLHVTHTHARTHTHTHTHTHTTHTHTTHTTHTHTHTHTHTRCFVLPPYSMLM